MKVSKVWTVFILVSALWTIPAAFAEDCLQTLSAPATAEVLIAKQIERIFNTSSQDEDHKKIDAYLLSFLLERVNALPARLRSKYIYGLSRVQWVDRFGEIDMEKGVLGTFNPTTQETKLSKEVSSLIARMVLVHELTHLEQYLTKFRRILRSVIWDNTLKIERDAMSSEYDFVKGLFAKHPELGGMPPGFLFVTGSKEDFLINRMKYSGQPYRETNAALNSRLVLKLGGAYAVGGMCLFSALGYLAYIFQ